MRRFGEERSSTLPWCLLRDSLRRSQSQTLICGRNEACFLTGPHSPYILIWGCRLSERITQQKRQRFVAANEGAEPLQLHQLNKGTYSKYKGNLYVVGSNPTPSVNNSDRTVVVQKKTMCLVYDLVVQSVRMLACHARGHGFKSRSGRQL